MCPSGLFDCGIRRRRRPVSRCGSRIRALFQMKQEIPFGTGPRRSKWDFLLHLGLSGGGLSHLISTIFEKLLAPARGIAYINNPQADMAQLVEHNLAKVGVAGSSPVVRSIACIGPVFESALFISTAKWPSGKAEACKAFTPGSNPGFASRSPKGPSERRAPFRLRAPDTNRAGGAAAHGTPGGYRQQASWGGAPRANPGTFPNGAESPIQHGRKTVEWDFLLHLGFEPLLRAACSRKIPRHSAFDKIIICRLCINCTFIYILGLLIHC